MYAYFINNECKLINYVYIYVCIIQLCVLYVHDVIMCIYMCTNVRMFVIIMGIYNIKISLCTCVCNYDIYEISIYAV